MFSEENLKINFSEFWFAWFQNVTNESLDNLFKKFSNLIFEIYFDSFNVDQWLEENLYKFTNVNDYNENNKISTLMKFSINEINMGKLLMIISSKDEEKNIYKIKIFSKIDPGKKIIQIQENLLEFMSRIFVP